MSPCLIGFIVLGGGPILFSLIISFCHYDALHPARLAGLQNYTQLLGFHHDRYTGRIVSNDPDFWTALGNTAFMVIGVPISIVLGLFLAMLLAHEMRGIGFFRTMFYLPSIVPGVAMFLLWIWIFDPTRGLLNQTLMSLGDAPSPGLAEQCDLGQAGADHYGHVGRRRGDADLARGFEKHSHAAVRSRGDRRGGADSAILSRHVADDLALHLFQFGHGADRRSCRCLSRRSS